ncbi:PREDICTED: GDSL esterase/lipase At2g40250-like [Nelumbo nucifera]|uniref:GDSL esterase/lipase At2g40250-like n=2 Tax=Nelumbo nucifera TaxID=4432 RepID=A0A1U8Q0A5_NELNU|nr:PREDICTED: GDSL esterase/lipase At2g40250-like [Nelumbo nucifera]
MRVLNGEGGEGICVDVLGGNAIGKGRISSGIRSGRDAERIVIIKCILSLAYLCNCKYCCRGGGSGGSATSVIRMDLCILKQLSAQSLAYDLIVSLNAAAPSKISVVFAFGDSTLDPDNNNHLGTLFRGYHPPYGRDFPGHIATGSRHIDDLTATISNVAHMSTQLRYFEQSLARMQGTVGREAPSRIVEDALFAIGVGTDDMIFNFYDLPTRRGQFSLPAYHDFLLQNLESFVMVSDKIHSISISLSQPFHNIDPPLTYDMKWLTCVNAETLQHGSTKVLNIGAAAVGCLPVQQTVESILSMPGGHLLQRACNAEENQDSQAYNAKLQALVLRLQATLPGSRFAYIDIYNPLLDMISNPRKYGFVETRRGCCGMGLVEMGGMCNSATPVCPDASKFVFWDAVHPTQATYQILANIFTATVLPRLVS